MAVPTQQYMRLYGGADHTTYTGNKIKIGDNIKVSGSDSNDGVFTISDIVDIGSGISFTDNSCDTTNGSSTIAHDANANIAVGLAVSGTGIPSNSYVKQIVTSTQFKLGDAIEGGGSEVNATADGSNVTLTFAGGNDIAYVLRGRRVTDETDSDTTVYINVQRTPGDKLVALGRADSISAVPFGIDVWSYNESTADSDGTPSLSENDGWTKSAINPTLKGDDAKYIFHFADEALRVCNINKENSSIVKWYGYIQRNQFGADEGITLSEWQEHPNNLSSPANDGGISLGFLNGAGVGNNGDDAHDGTNQAGNFYNSDNRGVSYAIKGPGSGSATNILLDGAITNALATSFHFDDGVTDGAGSDQFKSGDVITIGDSLGGALPDEYLLTIKPSLETGNVTFKRYYGREVTGITYGNDATPILKRGQAFNIGVTEDTSSGLWPENNWEFWQTFIYDGSQESLPVIVGDGAATTSLAAAVYPSSGNTTGNLGLKVSTFWDVAYNGRISGGRVYIRQKNSADPLTLFLDIDIVKGARTSMLDDHTPWTYETGDGFYVSGLISEGPSVDTYTSLNGFSSEEGFISIGRKGDNYQASVISGRRTFIANVTHKNKNNESIKHGDRIMYSEINKFDTFLESNFIDVSKGDYGEYVALESYADRLLAFKHNLLHVINISSPNPSAWFLESTVQHAGVSYSFSVTKTEFGVAWVNEFGCFLYDGQSTTNLFTNKIAVNNTTSSINAWSRYFNGSANVKDVMIGYDALSNSLILFGSPDDKTTSSNNGFMYCFNTGGWTYHTNIFSDSESYTSFINDWNNNLVIGYQSDADSVSFQKYLSIPKAQDSQVLITKDIDFGQPGLKKKIYKVIVTYRSTVEQQTPIEYAVDGTKSFSDFATGSNITPQGDAGGAGYLESTGNSGADWDVATFTADSIVTCQSIQFKFNPPTSGVLEINDITVEYRVISRGVVT